MNEGGENSGEINSGVHCEGNFLEDSTKVYSPGTRMSMVEY